MIAGALLNPGSEKESGLLRHRFVALRFQLGVLVRGKDCLGLLHKSGATLLGATIFHAFILPRHQFRILIGVQIKTRQIHATGAVIGHLRAFGAAT